MKNTHSFCGPAVTHRGRNGDARGRNGALQSAARPGKGTHSKVGYGKVKCRVLYFTLQYFTLLASIIIRPFNFLMINHKFLMIELMIDFLMIPVGFPYDSHLIPIGFPNGSHLISL